MANIWIKPFQFLAGNLNSGLSYFITTWFECERWNSNLQCYLPGNLSDSYPGNVSGKGSESWEHVFFVTK